MLDRTLVQSRTRDNTCLSSHCQRVRNKLGSDEQIFGAKQQDPHEEQSYLRMRRLDAGYECSEDVAA